MLVFSGIPVRQQFSVVHSALDASIPVLMLMAGKDTDRRLILDEMIENCLLLCKHLFSKFIIPATDPVSPQGCSSSLRHIFEL